MPLRQRHQDPLELLQGTSWQYALALCSAYKSKFVFLAAHLDPGRSARQNRRSVGLSPKIKLINKYFNEIAITYRSYMLSFAHAKGKLNLINWSWRNRKVELINFNCRCNFRK